MYMSINLNGSVCSQANRKLEAKFDALMKKMSAMQTTPASAAKAKNPAKVARSKSKAVEPQASDDEMSEEEQEEKSGSEEEEEEDLTEGAKLGRLRRLCERKPSGKLNVPEQVHEEWKKGGHSRQQLLEMLENAGWDKDPLPLCFSSVCCFVSEIFNWSFSILWLSGFLHLYGDSLKGDHQQDQNCPQTWLVHGWTDENQVGMEQATWLNVLGK